MDLKNGMLRNIQKSDLKMVLSWRNSERIRNSMINDYIISWEEHLQWFKRLNDSDDSYLVFEFNGQPAGMVYFASVDNYHGTCWWGFYLGEAALPPRTGLMMGYLGLNRAFNELKLRKICSKALSGNNISLNYHFRLGFKKEGCLQRQILKQERYEDIILLALFKDDWEKDHLIVKEAILVKGD